MTDAATDARLKEIAHDGKNTRAAVGALAPLLANRSNGEPSPLAKWAAGILAGLLTLFLGGAVVWSVTMLVKVAPMEERVANLLVQADQVRTAELASREQGRAADLRAQEVIAQLRERLSLVEGVADRRRGENEASQRVITERVQLLEGRVREADDRIIANVGRVEGLFNQRVEQAFARMLEMERRVYDLGMSRVPRPQFYEPELDDFPPREAATRTAALPPTP